MGSFGEHLRREREMRGVSLDEIVATTKIGRRLLVALEEEQFELLPGGIFNKSYVRAYAKCVGIDEDEAVAEYLQAAHEAPPDTRVIAQQHASIHSTRAVGRPGFPIMPILILLVVVAGGIGGWKVYQDRQRQKREALSPAETTSGSTATAPAAANSSQPASAEGATSQSSQSSSARDTVQAATLAPKSKAASAEMARDRPATSQSTEAGAPFEITVRPKDAAWVSIKADGQYVVRGIIRPPDVKTIRATNQVVFFTGNAGAVEVAFNGKNVPVAGGPNEEQVLVFDSRGVMPKTRSQTGTQ